MEVAFLVLSILLFCFALLAVFDGFFLHIFRYELHQQKESKTEHLMHTLRAAIFPLLLFFLFYIDNNIICFYIGIFLVMLDLFILGADAYLEKDSRSFMGGLPRWEYILHLFVNGFHFASIAVFLVIKFRINDLGFEIVSDFSSVENSKVFKLLVLNLLPGAVLMALLHILLIFSPIAKLWERLRAQFSCCKLQKQTHQ